jgi:starvation-inducible DNA-binding protein
MKKSSGNTEELESLQRRRLDTPTDLKKAATKDIAGAMNAILADVFALYLKTKNFHWHMSGPHFRDYHLLLDEHADQIFAMTDPIANKTLAARLREAHGVCDDQNDIATASLIEVWIDETERRTWFLFEAARHGDSTGH